MSYALYFRFHTCCETMVLQKTENIVKEITFPEVKICVLLICPPQITTIRHSLEFLIRQVFILVHFAGRIGPFYGPSPMLCEMVFRLFVIEPVFFFNRYVFKPKNRSEGDLTSKNNMQDGHNGQSNLKFTIF